MWDVEYQKFGSACESDEFLDTFLDVPNNFLLFRTSSFSKKEYINHAYPDDKSVLEGAGVETAPFAF